MFAQALSLVALLGVSNALAIARRGNGSSYIYMPVEFAYGSDSRVTTNITFGTGVDTLPTKVVMDTGSADTWVWGAGGVIHWGSQFLFDPGPCQQTVPNSYDPSKSSSSTTNNHTSAYAYAGNGKIVQGNQYANDTIAVQGGNGVIPNVQFAMENFGIIRQLDDGSCSHLEYDKAILGLSTRTASTQGPSFRQNLFDTGAIATKTMVMWFNKHAGALGQLTGGVLFGAIDESKYTGPLVALNMTTDDGQIGYYVDKPTTITFNNVALTPDADTNCLLDSGSHADSLPFAYDSDAQLAFFAQSGNMLFDKAGTVNYNGSCESIPETLSISYTFTGLSGRTVTIDVPLRNYARGGFLYDQPAGTCNLNLEYGSCLFGAPFSSASLFAVDDLDGVRPSIALAQAAVSDEGSGLDASKLKTFAAGETFKTV